MDSPAHMYYPQMLILLLLMGVCTIWLARLLQWIMLRKTVPRKKIFFVMLISISFSYVLALLFWIYWPKNMNPMWGIFFLPALLSELLILFFTLVFFKKSKSL